MPHPNASQITEAERRRITDLYRAGVKVAAICRIMSRSKYSVYGVLDQAGIEHRNAAEAVRTACEVCGELVRYVSPRQRKEGIGRFCSRACMGKAKRLPSASNATELSCTLCREVKPVSEFYPHAKITRGWQYWCKDCCQIKRRERASAPQDPNTTRKYRLKGAYGITQADYEMMYERQNGRCAICGDNKDRWEPGLGIEERQRFLIVDHDHGTSRVRALLCWNCNCALGHFRDDPVIMQAAIAYIATQEAHLAP